jgi:hypothetical protein
MVSKLFAALINIQSHLNYGVMAHNSHYPHDNHEQS